MEIQDTLSGGPVRLGPGRVRIYLCGVTVYDESHIGHARTIIAFDVLRRHLEGRGCTVELVQNFTDVDDKIIERARSEGVGADMLGERYVGRYHEDFGRLNVARASAYPRATEHMPDIISFIEGLVGGGFAYETKNGVYFEVAKFPEYGKLSKKRPGELRAGARVGVDASKKSPLDFALWKAATDGPSWESPWGRGRPGWHVECSAMSKRHLGECFELHGGGRDLIFPHHENEIAQSESLSGRSMAGAWMHVGMVTINGEKMSKSVGNVRTIRRALKEWGPNVIRLFCLSGHYSKPIDYTGELLRESLAKWRQAEACRHELEQAGGRGDGRVRDIAAAAAAEFDSALDDDLNTHLALSAFFRLVKEANGAAAAGTLGRDGADAAMPEFARMAGVLGLRVRDVTAEQSAEVGAMVRRREELREKKDYAGADRIRGELSKMGVEIIDRKGGTAWVWREDIPAEGRAQEKKA